MFVPSPSAREEICVSVGRSVGFPFFYFSLFPFSIVRSGTLSLNPAWSKLTSVHQQQQERLFFLSCYLHIFSCLSFRLFLPSFVLPPFSLISFFCSYDLCFFFCYYRLLFRIVAAWRTPTVISLTHTPVCPSLWIYYMLHARIYMHI